MWRRRWRRRKKKNREMRSKKYMERIENLFDIFCSVIACAMFVRICLFVDLECKWKRT